MQKIFRLLSLLIVASIVITGSGCATVYRQQKKKINENYQEGIQLYKQGDYKNAKEHFETVLSIDPQHSGAKQYLIITTEALQKRSKVYYDAGIRYKRQGNLENALIQFLQAEQRDPDYKDVKQQISNIRSSKYATKKYNTYYATAKKQYEKKRYIAAYQNCNKAELFDPNSLELKTLKARIKNQLDNNSYPYTSKAETAKKKNPALAKKYCNKALAVNPWDEKAQSIVKDIKRIENLNDLYANGEKAYKKGDYVAAYRAFKQIDNNEPGYRNTTNYLSTIKTRLEANINTYYQNGVTYYEQDNFKAAIAEWDIVLLINPDHQKAREYRERAVTKLELQQSLQ